MNAVVSRFGEDAHIEKIDQTHFKVYADVHASHTFYAWIVSFGGKVKIISPEKIIHDFSTLMNLLNNYDAYS